MADARKIPVLVLTGFLGSGKTTLLKKLLAEPAFADAGIVVNEFGEVDLDHALALAGRGERDMTVSTGGCLCCTAGSDVRASLADLLEAARAMPGRRLSRVVIETTGIADPAPVVNQLVPGGVAAMGLRDHTVARTFRLAGVATTVDAVLAEATLERHAECLKQVAFADRLILTKTDLLKDPASRADRDALAARLAAINPAAPVLDANAPDFDLSAAFAPRPYAPGDLGTDVDAWLALERAHGHHHDHDHAHDHDHHHRHGNGEVATVAHVQDGPVRAEDLSAFMDMLSLALGPRLLRLKGLVALADAPDEPLVLHAVQHVLHPVERLEAWPSADRRTRLVAIVHGVEPEYVTRLFATLSPRAAP